MPANIIRYLNDYFVALCFFTTSFLICLSPTLPVCAQSVPSTGPEIEEPIKIGLLLTESPSENSLMREAVDVVNLVIKKENQSGGIHEKPIKLFVKSVDGNWGIGSKRAVDLIFENGTTALLGFVDGRSAHLIEQVCTKAQVPFISMLSTDPALSRINIPWFFSTMPHAEQQAKVLVDGISKNYMNENIAVVSSDDYDQSIIRRSFLQKIEEENSQIPNVWTYPAGDVNFAQIASGISESDAEVIVFFGSSNEWDILISQLDFDDIEIPVYTSIIDLNDDQLQNISNPVFTIRSGNWDSEKQREFQADFYNMYGYLPGVYSAYLYDGTTALLEAIRSNGAESAHIQKELANMEISGINGMISFDILGSTRSTFMISEMP
ncbi:MAG: ABC transporter substrate-binding protein [Balneolaceae bacterium]|nr:ABC transporter substrate-binding protein [Balneolaceae bacterium]